MTPEERAKAHAAKSREAIEIRDGVPSNKVFVQVIFTHEQFKKLEALAERRNMTVQEVLRGYASAIQPKGSGWEPPWKVGKKK